LIEKRTKGKNGIIAYNTSFGIISMKQHVEVEHLELFDAYAAKFVGVESNSWSQSRNFDGNKVVQLANKCQKITPNVIFTCFGSKTPYKNQDEV
jgi:hypothetical protein